MKKLVLTTAVALVAGSLSVANASDKLGMYTTVKGGLGVASVSSVKSPSGEKVGLDSYKSRFNYSFGIAAGYDFSELLSLPIRIEAEYSYLRNDDFDKDKDKNTTFTSHLFLTNAYYDFSNLVPALDEIGLTPYVGAGIGYAHNNINNAKDKNKVKKTFNGGSFAFNLGLGVNYKIMDDLSINAGYRYIKVTEAQFKSGSEKSGKIGKNINQFTFGVTYSF